ncbi:MAG: cation transporter, partial [Bdellovibrio sp.]
LDSALALALTAWISIRVVQQFLQVGAIFLQALPSGLAIAEVEKSIAGHVLVAGVHHTHLWSLDGEEHILTAHVQLKQEVAPDRLQQIKAEIKQSLLAKFDIAEATIEFEFPAEQCEDTTHRSR